VDAAAPVLPIQGMKRLQALAAQRRVETEQLDVHSHERARSG
jgi:hypothetical protein